MKINIVEELKTVCDQENEQDKKLLFLAELVENRCTTIEESLDKTNEKLDTIIDYLKKLNVKKGLSKWVPTEYA